MIYELYGLTEDEIRIVEKAVELHFKQSDTNTCPGLKQNFINKSGSIKKKSIISDASDKRCYLKCCQTIEKVITKFIKVSQEL